MSLLEVDDIHVRFHSAHHTVRSVDGVSFRLEQEETVGIVGESGSGKSVLSWAILGLLPRSAESHGQVRFDGMTLDPTRQNAEMAVVLQDPMTSLNPVVRVGRQITEPMRLLRGMSRAEASSRAVELLTQVGISAPAKRLRAYPHELSGGMRQRVAIAAALACSPRLLIADEPTTALDVTIQHQILDLLQEAKHDQGMAMIIVSHDLGVVAGRTDHVAVMYAGRIVEKAPTRRLFESVRHPYTQALLRSVPRLEHATHRRIPVVPGNPATVSGPRTSCAFAQRCYLARPRCLNADPPTVVEGGVHSYACFYPVGTPGGAEALRQNLEDGHTATGLTVTSEVVDHG